MCGPDQTNHSGVPSQTGQEKVHSTVDVPRVSEHYCLPVAKSPHYSPCLWSEHHHFSLFGFDFPHWNVNVLMVSTHVIRQPTHSQRVTWKDTIREKSDKAGRTEGMTTEEEDDSLDAWCSGQFF